MVPRDVSMRRAQRRFLSPTNGRYVPLRLIAAIDEHPEQTYSDVRYEADTYQRFDNNVAQGEAPGLVERGDP
jgi:hypothetical protein